MTNQHVPDPTIFHHPELTEDAADVFANAVSERWLNIWKDQYILIEIDGEAWFTFLRRIGKFSLLSEHDRQCGTTPRWVDHSTLWKHRESGELVFFTQPYHLSPETLSELASLSENGLGIWVDTLWTFHYPSRTLGIRITKKVPL